MTNQNKFDPIDFIAGAAPWLTPIPTAYLVGRATYELLGWHLLIAICAAVIVESLGLAGTATALTLWNYNQARRKVDPRAPFGLAALVVGVYICVAIGLTVALDIYSNLATFAPAIFPVLSLAGVTVLALRSDHRRRLDAITQDKAERKAERQAVRQLTTVNRKAQPVKPLRQVSTVNLDKLLDVYKADPLTGPTQAARLMGVSRQTIYNQLAELETAGAIRKNGHGVEVLE